MHAVEPAIEYSSGEHAMHALAKFAAVVFDAVSAGQSMHDVARLGELAYLPAPHTLQDIEPRKAEYDPAPQSLHGAEPVAENCPGLHVRGNA